MILIQIVATGIKFTCTVYFLVKPGWPAFQDIAHGIPALDVRFT
jgi:hypothetical protein